MQTNLKLQDWWLDRFFSSSITKDFYLTGGTALARFYFHHRESIDLDFFTNNQSTDLAQVAALIEGIIIEGKLQIINKVQTPTFLQYILTDPTGENLKIDVVKDIPVHFGELVSKGNIKIDSLENIGSNKITAILGRTEAKDFIDFYWILHETPLKFEALLEDAKEKDLGLSEFYFANSLAQVEKLQIFPMMLKPFDQTEMKKFFAELSQKLFQEIKPRE